DKFRGRFQTEARRRTLRGRGPKSSIATGLNAIRARALDRGKTADGTVSERSPSGNHRQPPARFRKPRNAQRRASATGAGQWNQAEGRTNRFDLHQEFAVAVTQSQVVDWCSKLIEDSRAIPDLEECLKSIPALESLKDLPAGTRVLVRGDTDVVVEENG